jgi:hypothetical protein
MTAMLPLYHRVPVQLARPRWPPWIIFAPKPAHQRVRYWIANGFLRCERKRGEEGTSKAIEN